MPVAAFSPDHIAAIVSVRCGRFNAVMEYKTRATARTVQQEQAAAKAYGIFTTVELTGMGSGFRLNAVIPESSHRLQILHSIACSGITHGYLVYASSTYIIRVVHVVVSESASHTYQSALKAIALGYMEWVYTETASIPEFETEQLGHCVDQATLVQTLGLWRALVKLINERQNPLPPAKHIMPTLIALWNRVKGGIDVYSRYLKNVKSKHFRLTPSATIWLRLLMTLVYNAYQSFLLFQVASSSQFARRIWVLTVILAVTRFFDESRTMYKLQGLSETQATSPQFCRILPRSCRCAFKEGRLSAPT